MKTLVLAVLAVPGSAQSVEPAGSGEFWPGDVGDSTGTKITGNKYSFKFLVPGWKVLYGVFPSFAFIMKNGNNMAFQLAAREYHVGIKGTVTIVTAEKESNTEKLSFELPDMAAKLREMPTTATPAKVPLAEGGLEIGPITYADWDINRDGETAMWGGVKPGTLTLEVEVVVEFDKPLAQHGGVDTFPVMEFIGTSCFILSGVVGTDITITEGSKRIWALIETRGDSTQITPLISQKTSDTPKGKRSHYGFFGNTKLEADKFPIPGAFKYEAVSSYAVYPIHYSDPSRDSECFEKEIDKERCQRVFKYKINITTKQINKPGYLN